MKKLILVAVMVMVMVAGTAFAQDTDPPVFDFGILSAGGEIVILPFSDGPKTLAGASLELARAWDVLSLNALLASNFHDRNMAGLSFDVDMLKALGLIDKGGHIQWMQTGIEPSIGIGVVADIDSLFDPNEYEMAIHLKVMHRF